ncbi:MAG: class I SAM-dependent methyltransferase family protein [Candidatus Paceibacterota bacterium]|jgi:hypothetical protein
MHNKKSIKIEIARTLKAPEIETIKKPHLTVRSDRYENFPWPYVLSLPFMWLITLSVMLKKKIYEMLGLGLPKINSIFFDGLGKESRKVKEYATTWRAMEIVYNHPYPSKKTLGGLLDDFYWFGLNCQGLRNRLKLIKDELRKAISKIDKSEEIRLVSLACGSAESVIEVIAEAKAKGKIIKAKFVDIDGAGIERARATAKHYGVEDQIEMQVGSIYDVIESYKEFKPQIVEMMGFLDYISQKDAIYVVGKIREMLEPNGFLITCNIHPNIEQHFLKWVINWPMVYRSPKELSDVAEKAGFTEYRLIYEPLKVHGLLVAKKS